MDVNLLHDINFQISVTTYTLAYYFVKVTSNKKVGVELYQDVYNENRISVSELYDQNVELENNANEQIELKMIADQEAALRSLKTNVYLILIFFLPFILFLTFHSKVEMIFCCSLLFSVHKGVMTVLTTIANFGTIREVANKYWTSIFK